MHFALREMRPRLDALRFFSRLEIDAERLVEELGAVLLTKAVLMPVRLLYVMQPDAHERPFVSADAAIQACGQSHGHFPWWQLVRQAMDWRQSEPLTGAQYAEAATLLRLHARDLYEYCLSSYAKTALQLKLPDAHRELLEWRDSLRGGPSC